MPYTKNSDIGLYLLSEINFDLDNTPVLLYGGIQLNGTEAMFEMGNTIPFITPATKFTTSVPQPFGMTGVTLEALNATGVFKKSGEVDLSLTAKASFPHIQQLSLEAACIFEKSAPRLIVVQLISKPALTLTQFITDILGSTWSFADSVTNEFAFIEGEMYYLKTPAKAPSSYTFSYTLPGNSSPTIFKSGYNISGSFQIFEKYNFQVDLTVQTGGILLNTVLTTPLTVIQDVVTLKNPALSISTISPSPYLKVSTGISLFNTDINAALSAEYLTSQHLFQGDVDVIINNVSIPNMSGSSTQSVQLNFEFQWSKTNGFQISNIGGLPSNDLELLSQFINQLNSMGGGCETITNKMISDLGLNKTTVSLALNGTPKKNGANFEVPLNLNCDVHMVGQTIPTATIPLSVSFPVPKSLKELPEDIWQFIVNNAPQLTEQLLSNPDTYKAIAIAAAQKGLGSLAARMICRALSKFGQAIAEEIADDAIAGTAADTLAGAIELAAAAAAVALVGVGGIVTGLVNVLKKIWNWLTGSDNSDKKKAEDQINQIQQNVDAQLTRVFNIINNAADQIKIKNITVGINAKQQFEANWEVVNYSTQNLGDNASLSYSLTLLSGTPGSTTGSPIGNTFNFNNTNIASYQEPLNNIQAKYPNYQLNASISSKLSGIAVLSTAIQTNIQDSINELNKSGNSVAENFANYLQNKLNTLLDYNKNGIVSQPVYATLANTGMRVGQSLLGLNSVIGT
jgi:hypothetical protein